MRGAAFAAWALVGAKAAPGDRRDLMEAYRSIRFPPALTLGAGTPPAAAGPAFVLSSGYVLGRPASWMARAGNAGVCMDIVVGSGPARDPCRRPIDSRGPVRVVKTGPWATVIGTVSLHAGSVQAVLAGGGAVIGEIVPAPPFLHASFDFFVVELPIQSRGEVVAMDSSGTPIGERPFDPPALPVVAHGRGIGARWILLDREQSNGVRCIDFAQGHGDQGSICPTAVPSSRDVQAAVMPLAGGRKLVISVASRRVAYVQVQYLNATFVPAHMIHIPNVFTAPGALLPPIHAVFAVPIESTDGALVVAFDRFHHPIDGLPLGTAGSFGE
jgi:hypothetical protein